MTDEWTGTLERLARQSNREWEQFKQAEPAKQAEPPDHRQDDAADEPATKEQWRDTFERLAQKANREREEYQRSRRPDQIAQADWTDDDSDAGDDGDALGE